MKRILPLALALLFVSTSLALAQIGNPADAPRPKMMGPGHPMGWQMNDDDDDNFMPGMCGIEFTDEQQAKLDKLRLDGQKVRLERRAQMVDLQAKLKLAMTADKYSQKDIDDIAAKMGKFHQEAVLMRAKHLKEVRDMLTPEQRIKFDQHILSGPMGKGFPGRCGDMPGKGKGPGCGFGCDDDFGGQGRGHRNGCN